MKGVGNGKVLSKKRRYLFLPENRIKERKQKSNIVKERKKGEIKIRGKEIEIEGKEREKGERKKK